MEERRMTDGRTWISRLLVGFLTLLIGILAVPLGLLLTVLYLVGRMAERVILWRDQGRNNK